MGMYVEGCARKTFFHLYQHYQPYIHAVSISIFLWQPIWKDTAFTHGGKTCQNLIPEHTTNFSFFLSTHYLYGVTSPEWSGIKCLYYNGPLPWLPVKCPLTIVGWMHLDQLFSSVQRDKTPNWILLRIVNLSLFTTLATYNFRSHLISMIT